MKRIVYLIFIIGAITVLVLSCNNIFSQLNQNNIDMQFSNDAAVTYRLKEHIVESIYKMQEDTIFTASYMEEHIDDNLVMISNPKNGMADVGNTISGIIKIDKIINSLSYIDAEGKNAMFIDKDGLADKSLLKETVKDSIFQKTSLLKQGEVYVYFDEDAFYISSPVYKDLTKFAGIVITVADKKKLLEELQFIINEGNIVLMDDTGKYILTSSQHYGRKNFLDEYPKNLLTGILQSQSGNHIYENETLMTYTPIEMNDRKWVLVLHTDKESVTAGNSALYKELVGVLIVVIFAIIAVIVFWSNSNKKVQLVEREKKQKEQLESLNKELMEKQNSLIEQNSIIEELNSQLEGENYKHHQQKEILQVILESLEAGILMTDIDGSVLFINKAWRSIFSYIETGDKLFSQNSFCINGVTLSSTEWVIKNMMAGIENGQEIHARLLSLLHDKQTHYSIDMEQTKPVKRFLNLYSNPCVNQNDSSFGRVFVIRDISHQKEVDRLKLELISTVSHELRTPMSSIMGFSELLLTRALPEERSKEYMSIINSEAKRLTNLINDFLDIQRMESGKQVFNKQLNSIDQIIEESIKLFQNNSDKHRIIYQKGEKEMPMINCDKDKMLQVLSNLLSNAIKYSPNGGDVRIVSDMDQDRVKIRISDQGLGIPNDVKGKLFTKFFRINNDDRRKIGGTGLGLAICKEIIRAHGGEIGVESNFGQGSTFFFCLPYKENSSCELAKKNNDDLYIKNEGDVLIVEDDESMVKLMREILQNENLEMHAVSSGEEALRLAASNSYKLILLDICLNGQLNGWDVIKGLKSNQRTANIPIVISSVYENKEVASQNNIADYLVKPFEPEQLMRTVQKAIKGNLNSKMMVSSDELTEVVLNMLGNIGIGVKQIDHSGNMMVITIEEEGGRKNE